MDHDVDAGWPMNGRTVGLAVCLGVLYHLKNPYLVLEALARHSRYCLLSTRVAQVTVSGAGIEREPVAYLLDPREANNDPTNYWIFSDAGLRRILDRTGWDILDFATTGCDCWVEPGVGGSGPASVLPALEQAARPVARLRPRGRVARDGERGVAMDGAGVQRAAGSVQRRHRRHCG